MQRNKSLITIIFIVSTIMFPPAFAEEVQSTTLIGHTRSVTGVEFSPDGNFVASGGLDGKIILWNVHTGEQVRTFESTLNPDGAFAFSPDGKMIASQDEWDVRLWYTEDTELEVTEPFAILKGHENLITDIVFSPDGKIIVTASMDETARFWDVNTYEEVRTLTAEGNNTYFKSLAFSHDGRYLATGTEGSSNALVWDPDTGEILQTLETNFWTIHAVEFSPIDYKLVVGGWGGLHLWDAETGTHVHKIIETSNVFDRAGIFVMDIAFNPDGITLAVTENLSSFKLWDVNMPAFVNMFEVPDTNVRSVAFSPDGSTVVSASGDNTVRLWTVGPPTVDIGGKTSVDPIDKGAVLWGDLKQQ